MLPPAFLSVRHKERASFTNYSIFLDILSDPLRNEIQFWKNLLNHARSAGKTQSQRVKFHNITIIELKAREVYYQITEWRYSGMAWFENILHAIISLCRPVDETPTFYITQLLECDHNLILLRCLCPSSKRFKTQTSRNERLFTIVITRIPIK